MNDEESQIDNNSDTFLFYHNYASFMKRHDKTTILVNIKHLFDYDVSYDLREAIISEYHR